MGVLWGIVPVPELSVSYYYQHHQCIWIPNGKRGILKDLHIFMSCIAGSFQVVDSTTLDDIVGFHHRKEEISDIKFSPGKH